MSTEEKEIGRQIAYIFRQQVCGFDLLRAKGISYVCDVNGWSFVKGNPKYYSDSAYEIVRMVLTQLSPTRIKEIGNGPISAIFHQKCKFLLQKLKIDPMFMRPIETMSTKHEELRSVVAIFRHGDRTPKQKMKLLVTEPEFVDLFEKGKRNKEGKFKDLKMKSPKRLQAL